MKFALRSGNFSLELSPQTFEIDTNVPVNTVMKVNVQSGEFKGSASMDIDIRALAKFADELCQIYTSLVGEAKIEEPYGHNMFLSFAGDGRGHITVRGYLHDGSLTSLKFKNVVDQTSLSSFCFALRDAFTAS